jgi:hypothetical protein
MGGNMKNIKYLLFVICIMSLVGVNLHAQAEFLNQKPCMYDGMINPLSGMAKTAYIATVHYYDPDGKKPTKILVFVDDISYMLKRASGKSFNGIYKCKLMLPPGEHKYYFYAEDDYGADTRTPRYGVFKGPVVSVTKLWVKPAALSNGGCIEETGSDRTICTYTVHYKDPDTKPPVKLYVFVDGIKYPMSLHKGVKNDGDYIAMLTLPAGKHAYYFKAMDALGHCISLPEDGFIRGPEISATSNNPPRLFDVKLDPPLGYNNEHYNYSVIYNDEDFDPPSIMNIVIDGIPYPINLKSGKTYNGVYGYRSKLYLGNFHNYYFYCEDGRGGSYRIPATGTFHGPVVVK